MNTLEERRVFNDLVFLFKMIHGYVDMSQEEFFEYGSSRTRGHRYENYVKSTRLKCHKMFFINRTVPIWINLPSIVV